MIRESRPAARRRGEGGFALLVALLTLVALSIVAAGGVFLARSERRISHGHRAAVAALEIARGGLAEYLASAGGPVPRRTFVYGRDTAEVTSTRLLLLTADSLEAVHRLTARGVRSGRGGAGRSRRTVHAVALRGPGRLTPAGALAVGGPVRLAGGPTVTLDGEDACGGAGGGGGSGSTAGVAVAPGDLLGDASAAAGDPPVDDSRPPAPLLRSSGLDAAAWADLKAGWPGTRPDVYVSGPGEWPGVFTDWPVIRLEGDSHVLGTGDGGRGTIIAPGDLILGGAFRWEGLVLVGGALSVVESARVEGAALSGLDVLEGTRPDTSHVGGTAAIRYDSCRMRRAALELFGGLVEKPGSRQLDPGR